MRLEDGIQLALRTLAAHRMRSFLTLLGIAVGIAAVILLTSIGEGIHRFVLAEFSQFGTNVIAVTPGKLKTAGAPPSGIPTSVRPLTLEDARALAHLPNVIAVTPVVWGNSEVGGNGRLRRTTVYGVNAAMLDVIKIKIRAGQFLPDEEGGNPRAFIVLGATVKNELFGSSNPLGARVRIGSMHFRVIGVLEAKGQMLGIDLDDTAFIPAERALELYNRDGLMEIDVSHREDAVAAQVGTAIQSLLKERHGREDFTVTTQEDMLRTLSKILGVLTMAVGALGSISLLVGGVGIVTIMTIAVTERTSEIGLLVALGAQRRTILAIFLGEAVTLSALGGILGLLLGFGIAQLIHLLLPGLPVKTPLLFVILAEFIAVGIGLIAGVLPARRAAGLNAVEALRAE